MTLPDAAEYLRPQVTANQLRRIIAQLPGLNPISSQASGGRPVDVYSADDLMELHHALRRWL